MTPPIQVILRPEVPEDLHSILLHLEQAASEELADKFVSAVFSAINELAIMPGMGSPKRFRGTTSAGIRSWWVPGFETYIIYYRASDHALIVLAILHGSRNIGKALRDRK